MTPKRVLYVDLDGTIRHGFDELGRFVNGPEDVVVFDGVPELLGKYKVAGWRIIGVSNQGGIALGHTTQILVREAMAKTNKLCGEVFDRITWCSHHPAAADPEMAICWCRKPRIGGLVLAAQGLADQHRTDYYPPHLGLFVGDRPEDEECAKSAGLPFMWAKDWREQGPFVRPGMLEADS